jgi:hypothetical protein
MSQQGDPDLADYTRGAVDHSQGYQRDSFG